MNDMYWKPGGNMNLKNEFSYTGELAYEMSGRITAPFSYKTELTLFSNVIKDMIQWEPGTYGYWSPSNIKDVRTTGIETAFSLSFISNSLTLQFNGQYAFNKAHAFQSDDTGIPSGKQLVYVPMHQFTGVARVCYRNIHASWITGFTGKRFIVADNSQYLPGFLLNDVMTGLKLKSGESSIDLNIKIENLFNINYQAMAYHPMPQRSFLLTIVYQLIKKP
jgi:iron complex outermembrane receptor protein